VISGAFFKILLHNYIINIKKYFSFSGEAKDSVIFPFFFYFIRELKPIKTKSLRWVGGEGKGEYRVCKS